jgi:A/G-specific adenine glycosylase
MFDVKDASRLLDWYAAHARDLLWRKTRAPYPVWVSEIMLQQTRVDTVIPYYERFLNALPDVRALAKVDEGALLKLWEGLGYYSRARHMKRAAGIIVTRYDGVFPNTPEAVRALPGIGPYTAGAILSICFDLPCPAVDGNVLRVVARLLDMRDPVDDAAVKRRVEKMLEGVYLALPKERAGDFTQALMELGATVCVPNGAPDCARCPLGRACCARRDGTMDRLPVRAEKRARREEDITVLILRNKDRYAIRRRADKGLLAGLYELPNAAGRLTKPRALAWARDARLRPAKITPGIEATHVFTHIRWRMRSFVIECGHPSDAYIWATPRELSERYALPSAFGKFIEKESGE